ncbi:SIS domain-containing protein [Kushneria phosphatilytica]|uniref:SIS domain-containing protein n=2 Tax=Kushneria phosphatilytica TaxID=657387 RepID=A0A5C1A4V2_9GAMM|nr:SIS domain-containing protein [Kushneria phosphatilytica]
MLGVADAETRGAAHTVREIAQQPRVWRTLFDSLQSRRREIDSFLEPLLSRAELRIVLTGAGTSAFGGQMLAATLTAQLQRPVEAIATTDIVSRPQQCFPDNRPVLLISFARSGNSPESIAATELAEQCVPECHHLVVTCNPQGKLFGAHDTAERSLVLLMPEAADDQGFAMTSSITAMMLAVLCALAPELVDNDTVTRLSVATEQLMAVSPTQIAALAQRGFERIVYLGSGPFKDLAQESALKILELSAGRVMAYHDTPLGFRHGPKSLLDERTLVVVFLSNDDYARQYDLDILRELGEQQGKEAVIAISARAPEQPLNCTLWQIRDMAQAADWALLYPYLVQAQLLALHTSLALGKTPDNPFPSGEVNRVVKGVTIHPFEAKSR